MNILIVGGTFDYSAGKPSKIIAKLSDAFSEKSFYKISILNGGHIDLLKNINFKAYDIAFWAPNISNDENKIIPNIKSENPRLFLISSKRVVEKEYRESDVVGRLLKSKSNLGVMITKIENRYHFKLLDPLGNCFINTDNINQVATAITERVQEIKAMTRLPSIQIGERQPFQINEDFLKFVRHSSTEFSKHVNAINPNRLLGNASTRCMFGFPAEKQQDRLFVTQRNIDKQLIKNEGFVEIKNNEEVVQYFGEKKPSVDTPIQIRLFNFYKNINYMVHGHVYIDNAKTTDKKVPCGYIEEFDEIKKLYPDPNTTSFAVNLKGHGCLLLANTVEELWKLGQYTSRSFPEY